MVENQDSADDFEFPSDHENNEPNRQMPISSPVHKGGGDEAGHEERLVGEWVKNGSGDGLLVEVTGDPSVDPVEDRGQGEDCHCEPA